MIQLAKHESTAITTKHVIKYFNYINANRIAPVAVKLKVLKSCVMSTLLYNCETWGPHIPDGLDEMYIKRWKSALYLHYKVLS